jgi:hypothetical protein
MTSNHASPTGSDSLFAAAGRNLMRLLEERYPGEVRGFSRIKPSSVPGCISILVHLDGYGLTIDVEITDIFPQNPTL